MRPGDPKRWQAGLRGATRVVAVSFRSTLPRVALAALAATALALIAAWWTPPEPDAAYHPATLWLHLALGLTLVAGVASAVEAWPGFGTDQPGRGALLRLRVGPLDGLPAAALGGLLAIAPCLVLAGALFELADARDTARPLTELTRPIPRGTRAVLHPGQPELEFELPATSAERAWEHLELRPRAIVTSRHATLDPARITVLLDGRNLGEPLAFALTGDLARIALPRSGDRTHPARLTLRREPGPGVALAFETAALTASRAAPLPPPWQTLSAAGLAGLSAVAAALVGLTAAAFVAALGASRGLGMASGAVLALLSGPIGASTHGTAVEALAADHWISGGSVAEGFTGSLSTALLAMLAAGLLRSVGVR